MPKSTPADGVVRELPPEGSPLSAPGEIPEELTPEEELAKSRMEQGEEAVETPIETPGVGTSETLSAEELAAKTEEVREKPAPHVPLAEVQKEREKRQAAEKQLKDLEERYNRADERLKTVNDLLQARQQTPEQDIEPNKEDDPFAWYEWRIRQVERLAQQSQQFAQQNQQNLAQVQQNSEQLRVAQQIQYLENQYAQQNPDYMPALDKLGKHLDMLFTPMYPDAGERQSAIQGWARTAVLRAAQLGKNPAELTYEICKGAGLTTAESKEAAATVAQVTGTQPLPDAQPRLVIPTLKKAAQAARSLSNVSGGAPKTQYTLEDLANMSDNEYENLKKSLGDNDDIIGRYT